MQVDFIIPVGDVSQKTKTYNLPVSSLPRPNDVIRLPKEDLEYDDDMYVKHVIWNLTDEVCKVEVVCDWT